MLKKYFRELYYLKNHARVFQIIFLPDNIFEAGYR